MSTEEEKNDDFLDALASSEMPDLTSGSQVEPKKSIESENREKMRQELLDRQKEERESENHEEVQTSKTDFDSVKPTSEPITEPKQDDPPKVNPEPTVVEQTKVSNDAINELAKQAKIDNETELKQDDPPKVEETPSIEVEDESPMDENPQNTVVKQESIVDKIDVLSSEEVVAANSKKAAKPSNVKHDVEISDNLNSKVVTINNEIDAQAYESNEEDDEDEAKDYTLDEITHVIDDNYVDDSNSESTENVTVDIVKSEEKQSGTESEKKPKKKTSKKKEIKTPFYGGDGVNSSFKLRSSKIGKVLRSVNIEKTDEIDPVDISNKTPAERQQFYLKSVLPILQPSMSVVPLVISGVVISMTAFGWPDLREIVEYEDKLSELDPSSMRDDEYIHAKNQLFIEKRRKQCDLFYKHITSVTGYVVKPSKEELFGKIIKFPDFPQLFFAAYAASFLKPYTFDIGCPICGASNGKSVVAKDLCFLLNSNIDIKRLNYFIQNGTALGKEETAKVYNEFQKEKIVELSSAKYRTKKNLPISSFIYELSIPTVYEALNTMEEIIEVFRDVDLSYTNTISDSEGNIINAETVYIDSSFGLTSKLLEMRKYLYISSLIVPEIVSENKETKTAKIGFTRIDERSAVIQSIYNLSSEDYNILINDINLNKLVDVAGIRHAIKGGNCSEPTCGADLGFVQAEPETLFFILARNALRS